MAFLATRVTKCTDDDVDKLKRVMRHIATTKERGVILRPGKKGVHVCLYIDAAYGVHSDGKSHTGSCVVIGDVGAIHCKSSKQSIVTKSSTEAELIALSDSANQGLYIRNFLLEQGHKVGPVTMHGACGAWTVGSGENSTQIHQILLGARKDREKGSHRGAQGNQGNVRERTEEVAARSSVRLRARMPNRMDLT